MKFYLKIIGGLAITLIGVLFLVINVRSISKSEKAQFIKSFRNYSSSISEKNLPFYDKSIQTFSASKIYHTKIVFKEDWEKANELIISNWGSTINDYHNEDFDSLFSKIDTNLQKTYVLIESDVKLQTIIELLEAFKSKDFNFVFGTETRAPEQLVLDKVFWDNFSETLNSIPQDDRLMTLVDTFATVGKWCPQDFLPVSDQVANYPRDERLDYLLKEIENRNFYGCDHRKLFTLFGATHISTKIHYHPTNLYKNIKDADPNLVWKDFLNGYLSLM